MSEPIRFTAALAGQNSAARWLSLDSEGCAKIVLEVDASDLAAVMRLATFAKSSFKVSVEA